MIHNHLSSVSMGVQWGLRIGSVDLLGLCQIFLRNSSHPPRDRFRKKYDPCIDVCTNPWNFSGKAAPNFSYHLPTIQFSDMLVFRDCISVLFDGKNRYSFLLAKIYVRSGVFCSNRRQPAPYSSIRMQGARVLWHHCSLVLVPGITWKTGCPVTLTRNISCSYGVSLYYLNRYLIIEQWSKAPSTTYDTLLL